MANGFVHLHLHSEYSLLDGGNRIGRLVAHVKSLGMDSVAVTDHGNLFGAMHFYNACQAAGIKPIMGIEAYVAPDVGGAPGDRTVKEARGVADGGFHLVLLAENETGWHNLLKLSSDAYITGFYYRPRMDKGTLEQWNEGLIAINGHLGSSIAYHLVQYNQTRDEADYERAKAEAVWHSRVFGANGEGQPRFYLELQRHETALQDAINPHIMRLSEELNLPLVCDNDAHFMTAEDWDSHDTLICVSMGKLKENPDRLHYPKELYVKSPEQMAEVFTDVPQAVENTRLIADRCNVEMPEGANHAPVVKIVRRRPGEDGAEDPDAYTRGSTEWYKAFCSQYELVPFDSSKDHESPEQLKEQCDAALRELCEAGMVWRYGDGITDEHRARLERELQILADKLISAYFLIVWDFVNEARRRGIPAGARGSGVGTMVGYVLGLSVACPVEYGLLFERFTDPNRSEYPDIDIDMCQDGRQEIIEYVREKYGYVAQIITFGTMKARAAIRDVGRVLNLPLPDVDAICKLIGDGLGVTIKQALQQEPDLKKLYDENPQVRQVIDTAIRLEGISRHSGVHAAGVIIATQPLDNIVPLAISKQGQREITVTQWDGPTCEDAGLLKMDFLGLRTLSIIERARRFVGETLSEETVRRIVRPDGPWPKDWDPLDLDRLDFNDQKVFGLYQRGETAGTFQFESDGMRNMLLSMQPDRLEDLIAGNALFRPGPMALIDDYCDRKHGRASVPKVHPIVDKYTAGTYGIMVYQEQVMQIVHELGGIPLRDAYSLIKAISKKKEKIINANRATFIDGAVERGLDKRQAEELFDLILRFAGYGFNKSHSAGYSILAYQTAYLKTYFPIQYMAAVLTYDSDNTDKVVKYIDTCKTAMLPGGNRGIEVRPPDVNLSDVGFTVVFEPGEPRDADHGHIRFGLGAVKGVGDRVIEAVIREREKSGPFTSLYDFCERVPHTQLSKAVVEAFVKCGAFDSLHGIEQRAAMLAAVEDAMGRGAQEAKLRSSEDFLFGAVAQEERANGNGVKGRPQLPQVKAWSAKEQLDHEKSVIGFYLSSNPMDEHRDMIERFGSAKVADAKELRADVEVVIGAMLHKPRTTFVKKGRSAGQKMAMLTFEDETGKIDGVVFSDTYAVVAPLLEEDAILFFKGKVDRRREEPSIVVNDVIPMEQAAAKLTRAVKIVLHSVGGDGKPFQLNGELRHLQSILRQAAGIGGVDVSPAEVFMEIHQKGKQVLMRLNGTRIGVSADLPERIDSVLHTPGSCQLVGPVKLSRGDRSVAQDEGEPQPERLATPVAATEESCASIDRY